MTRLEVMSRFAMKMVSEMPKAKIELMESQDALKSYLASVRKHVDKLPAAGESVWRQRAPNSLHHRLQVEAKREGVSFNTLVISMLAEGLGRKDKSAL